MNSREIDLIYTIKQMVLLQTIFPLLGRIGWHVIPSRRRRNLYISKEAARLEKALKSGNLRQAVLVYDNSVSPPSYGDFINVLMIGRFLAANQIVIDLILTNTDYLEYFSSLLTKNKLDEFVEEEKTVAESLIMGINITVCTSRELTEVLGQREKNGEYIVFHDYVKNHRATYHMAFDLAKLVLANARSDISNLTLFSKNTTFVHSMELPTAKYIAFACRWNESWGQHRNMSAELFLNLVNLLRNEFPTYGLLAVSDRIGCDHFRSIANENQLACSFSKDYSGSFLGDAALVLNSEAWVQIRGGGIGIIPLWSDLPFLFFGRISNERSLLNKSTSHLRNDNQRFIVDYGLPSDRRIKKFLSQMNLKLDS
jgi:hypothetical protein